MAFFEIVGDDPTAWEWPFEAARHNGVRPWRFLYR